MEEQNKQQNEATLFSLLESANLLDYYERFLEQGGDDVDQLCDASEEEFKEITKLVGMQTKPLHIRRLQKSLVEWRKNRSDKRSNSSPSWMDKWPSAQTTQASTGITITKPTTATITITGSPCFNEQTNVVQKKRGRPSLNNKATKRIKSGVFQLKLPAMEAIIDWESLDDERRQLIREHSRIYGRDTKKRKTHALNGHEQMINEAAAQLCLRDPTLLVRRDELFTQARRIVRDSGFSFVHGHSRSKFVGETQNESEVPPSKLKRQERIQEIEQILETCKQRQETLTQKKKQLENEEMATNDIEQELSGVQREIISLQTEQKELEKRQRRSERYYITKESRKRSSDELQDSAASGEMQDSDIHLQQIDSVAEQEQSDVVELLQNQVENRTRDEQVTDEEQCVRNLFTIIPQHITETTADNNQTLRASILSSAPVGSTINALLSLSNEDKNNSNNIQALQNVLNQISLPHLMSNAIGTSGQHMVITSTAQDQNTSLVHEPVHYVQPTIAIVPHHLVNNTSSTTAQQIVATNTTEEHPPVTTQILHEPANIVQYSQQTAVPIIQNLIMSETQP